MDFDRKPPPDPTGEPVEVEPTTIDPTVNDLEQFAGDPVPDPETWEVDRGDVGAGT